MWLKKPASASWWRQCGATMSGAERHSRTQNSEAEATSNIQLPASNIGTEWRDSGPARLRLCDLEGHTPCMRFTRRTRPLMKKIPLILGIIVALVVIVV